MSPEIWPGFSCYFCGPCRSDVADRPLQALADLLGYFGQRRIAHKGRWRGRVDRGDFGLTGADIANDHVAREHDADAGFSFDRALREWRIAGAENAVRREVGAGFRFEGAREINLVEDAKALASLARSETSATLPETCRWNL